MKIVLDYSDLKKIHRILYDKSGLYFGENRFEFLRVKIQKRMEYIKIYNSEKYINLILNIKGELQELLNEITINETYFFRELNYLETYLDKIFSELIMSKKDIKIISSACSSGEEPYSLAILIMEKYPFMKERVKIIGYDIDSNVIKKAKVGEYTPFSLRATPSDIVDKYFNRKEKHYIIANEIKNMLEFYNMNIFDEKTEYLIKNSDLILSRNVLIYFDNESKKEAIDIYYKGLYNKGVLMLGKSESIFAVNNKFKIVHYPQVIFYQKEEI